MFIAGMCIYLLNDNGNTLFCTRRTSNVLPTVQHLRPRHKLRPTSYIIKRPQLCWPSGFSLHLYSDLYFKLMCALFPAHVHLCSNKNCPLKSILIFSSPLWVCPESCTLISVQLHWREDESWLIYSLRRMAALHTTNPPRKEHAWRVTPFIIITEIFRMIV